MKLHSKQTKNLRQLLDLYFNFETETDKKCLQSAYTKIESMVGMESLPFPDEIVLKILSYLGLGELIQCARVSKRLNRICMDKSLSYRSCMLAMKALTVKERKSIIDYLIARPEVREVTISLCLRPHKKRTVKVDTKK